MRNWPCVSVTQHLASLTRPPIRKRVSPMLRSFWSKLAREVWQIYPIDGLSWKDLSRLCGHQIQNAWIWSLYHIKETSWTNISNIIDSIKATITTPMTAYIWRLPSKSWLREVGWLSTWREARKTKKILMGINITQRPPHLAHARRTRRPAKASTPTLLPLQEEHLG